MECSLSLWSGPGCRDYYSGLRLRALQTANAHLAEGVTKNLSQTLRSIDRSQRMSLAIKRGRDDLKLQHTKMPRVLTALRVAIDSFTVTWHNDMVVGLSVTFEGSNHAAWKAQQNGGLLHCSNGDVRAESCVFLGIAGALLPQIHDETMLNAFGVNLLSQAQKEAHAAVMRLRAVASTAMSTPAQRALWLLAHQLLSAHHPVNPAFPALFRVPSLDGRLIIIFRCQVGEKCVARIDFIRPREDVPPSGPPIYLVADETAAHVQGLMPIGKAAEQAGEAFSTGSCFSGNLSASLNFVERSGWAPLAEITFAGHTRFLQQVDAEGSCPTCGAKVFT